MNYWIWIPLLLFIAWMLWQRRGLSTQKLSLLMAKGAQIVDVRSPAEFRGGHVPGSKNIPLDQIQTRSKELDPRKPVVLCCASGSRSAMAVSLLKRQGFTDVHNAGSWTAISA